MKIKKVSVGGTQYNLKDTTKIENGKCVNDFATNCIVEIPQDIKLELNNGTLTLKSGSKFYKPNGNQYTVTEDKTQSTATIGSGQCYILVTQYGNIQGFYANTKIEKVGSGATLPADGSTYTRFFNTTDLYIYGWTNTEWEQQTVCFPLGIVTITNNVITSIDKVFNGNGFIGHHAFVLPGLKAFCSDGYNSDGTLNSSNWSNSSINIVELPTYTSSTRKVYYNVIQGTVMQQIFGNPVDTIAEMDGDNWKIQFVRKDNRYYQYASSVLYGRAAIPLVSFSTNSSGIVTRFYVNPVQGLSSSELFESIKGAVGYDPTTTQTIKMVNGVLTWVTD